MNKALLSGLIIATVAFILTGIAVAIGGPAMLEGYEEMRTDSVSSSETFTNVAVSTNTSTVTLAYTPYPSATLTSVTSNVTGDVTTTYSVSGTTATFTAFDGGQATRTLAITYTYSSVDQYNQLERVIESGPTLQMLGFIISTAVTGFLGIGIAGYGAYKQAKG